MTNGWCHIYLTRGLIRPLITMYNRQKEISLPLLKAATAEDCGVITDPVSRDCANIPRVSSTALIVFELKKGVLDIGNYC